MKTVRHMVFTSCPLQFHSTAASSKLNCYHKTAPQACWGKLSGTEEAEMDVMWKKIPDWGNQGSVCRDSPGLGLRGWSRCDGDLLQLAWLRWHLWNYLQTIKRNPLIRNIGPLWGILTICTSTEQAVQTLCIIEGSSEHCVCISIK